MLWLFTKHLTEQEISEIEKKLLNTYSEEISFVGEALWDDLVDVFAMSENYNVKVKPTDELALYIRITEDAEIYLNTNVVLLSEAYDTLYNRSIVRANIWKMEQLWYRFLWQEYSNEYHTWIYIFLSPQGNKEDWTARNMEKFVK